MGLWGCNFFVRELEIFVGLRFGFLIFDLKGCLVMNIIFYFLCKDWSIVLDILFGRVDFFDKKECFVLFDWVVVLSIKLVENVLYFCVLVFLMVN